MVDFKINYDALSRVQKPARYIGGEINAVLKDPTKVKIRVALAFPDVYEVGMSHLGLKILYHILNSREDVFAERVFAPWSDMEQQMRDRGIPLLTLETHHEVRKMDIVGFSLQYELCATTALQMLDLSGIPLLSSERGVQHPLIIAGGPLCFNPNPMSDFFDLFLIGDGEQAIVEIVEICKTWKTQGGDRDSLLRELKKVQGVFVPSLFEPGETVSKRILPDLGMADFPQSLVVPFCDITHDRVGLEIARGCTRGCRFCQAGMIYRPVRERKPSDLLNLTRKLIESTGWDDIGLLSLSSGDYSSIGPLIRNLSREFASKKVAISLPSLRTDTFDSEIATEIRKVRKTGFTLAPEAGTERLRRVINKGNTEEDLKNAVVSAFQEGWKAVKLYFMIGLPTETEEDLAGIVDLIFKSSRWGRAGQIRASISTFVPKSHTPFQWAGQISIDETQRRQSFIKSLMRRKSTVLKFHNPKVSFLEGVFARGSRELGKVIECAYRKGARFDGWDEKLNFELWMNCFDEFGIDPGQYLKEKSTEEPLPWEFIQTGVTRSFLVDELELSLKEGLTSDCRSGNCLGCGVCDFKEIAPVLHRASEDQETRDPTSSGESTEQREIRKFRIRYSKSGPMKLLGHHDVVRCFERAFRRARLELDYSLGFHPHPKLRFSAPTALGIESEAEYLDFDLKDANSPINEILEKLQNALPKGIKPAEICETSLNQESLSARIQIVVYEIHLNDDLTIDRARDRLCRFSEQESLIITSGTERKPKIRDLKQYISSIFLSGQLLTMKIRMAPSGSVNPYEAIGSIMDLSDEQARSLRITKTMIEFES
ncbi:MAG: TIGR03960 family B12-binding radical SAM protein [Desulfomonilaceae bacterium]|jgi:radical SAM family uncharacterized protein/radical SAM-linked protein